MSAAGAVLFARYAYPPNKLGYCGPAGADALLDPAATAEITRRARRFEGVWAYLEFIARSVGASDPLAADVVAAYWVGNELLSRVDQGALVEFLRSRFPGQPTSFRLPALAHHTYQVFEVYPWAGLLRRGQVAVALPVLDRCRIRTGVVEAVHGSSVSVRCRPLEADLRPGPPRVETVVWGRSLLPALAPGDLVSLHWDWICDVITGEQRAWVERLESERVALAR